MLKTIDEWPPADKERVFRHLYINGYRSERYGIFYVATPKVACTSIKWWFAELEGHVPALLMNKTSSETDPELTIHDTFHKVAPNVAGLTSDVLAAVITSDAYFRFAVVRNPYKRVFSAWQSKLLLREPLQVDPYVALDFFNRPIGSMEEMALAFEGFLGHLAEREAPDYWDVHWTPQVALLRPDLIEYSSLVQIEHPKALSTSLAEWMGSDFSDPLAARSTNESLIPFLPELITPRSAELIRTLYADDFSRFGYHERVPEGEEAFTQDEFKVAVKAISTIRARHQRMGEMIREITNLNQTLAECTNLEAALVERNQEIEDLTRGVAAGKRQVAELQARLDEILESNSWKLTKPLRHLGRVLHRPRAAS